MRKDEGGSGSGDDGYCMIDPVVLGGVINDLATMESAITTEMKGLKAEFEKVGVPAQPVTDLVNVANWLNGELPMLRRRHAAAVLLESQGTQFFPGTHMLPMPEDPAAAAEEAASLAARHVRDGIKYKLPVRDGIAAAISAIESIRNTKGALTPDQLTFLETFYRDLGKDVYKVPDYLTNNDTEQTCLRGSDTLAGGLLTLSDERRGGGWNRLPEFVQKAASDPFRVNVMPDRSWVQRSGQDADDLAAFLAHSETDDRAGVVFSKRLAITAAQSVATYKQLSEIPPPVPYDEDETGRTFLQVASRNEQAMHDLLTGKSMEVPADVTANIYDGYTTPKDFLLPVTTNAWSDDGKAASEVIDWIADAKRSTDPTRQTLAGEAWTGLVTTLTDPAVFKAELDIGKKDSVLGMPTSVGAYPELGVVNPEITRSLARDASAYLSELAGDEKDELSSARLFTLIATDPASADALAGAVYQHNVAGIHDVLTHDDHLVRNAEPAGRLNGLLDAAVHNVALERTDDLIQAKADADAARGKILSITSDFVTKGLEKKIPSGFGMDPVDIADKLLGRLSPIDTTTVQPHEVNTEGVDPTSTSGGRILVRYNFTKALVESGQLTVEELPADIRSTDDPPRLMSPAEFDSKTYKERQDSYLVAIEKVPGVSDKLRDYLNEYQAHASGTADRRRATTREALQQGILDSEAR